MAQAIALPRSPRPACFGEFLKSCFSLPATRTTVRRLEAREVLFWWGDTSDDRLYLIVDGCVKTLVNSRRGKECLLGIYTRHDIVGESCLLGEERTETAMAMVPTSLVQIRRTQFLEHLSDHELRAEWLRYLTARLQEQQEVIAAMVTADSEQRLAATLLRLARKLGRPQAGRLHIDQRITQEELADMVGTTRSRVGLFLKRFRREGLIDLSPGSRLIVQEERLQAYVASV